MEPSLTLFFAAIVAGMGAGLGFAIINGIIGLIARGRAA